MKIFRFYVDSNPDWVWIIVRAQIATATNQQYISATAICVSDNLPSVPTRAQLESVLKASFGELPCLFTFTTDAQSRGGYTADKNFFQDALSWYPYTQHKLGE